MSDNNLAGDFRKLSNSLFGLISEFEEAHPEVFVDGITTYQRETSYGHKSTYRIDPRVIVQNVVVGQ